MYLKDLTDSDWQIIEEILADKRKRKYSLRAILNALFYLTNRDASGDKCLTTYRPGPYVITIFGNGAVMGVGDD